MDHHGIFCILHIDVKHVLLSFFLEESNICYESEQVCVMGHIKIVSHGIILQVTLSSSTSWVGRLLILFLRAYQHR